MYCEFPVESRVGIGDRVMEITEIWHPTKKQPTWSFIYEKLKIAQLDMEHKEKKENRRNY